MSLQKMTGGISFSFLDKDMYIHIGTDVFISRVNIDRCPFLFIDLWQVDILWTKKYVKWHVYSKSLKVNSYNWSLRNMAATHLDSVFKKIQTI